MRLTRIYLAGRYSRREELAGYAEELDRAGFSVRCSWLSGDHDNTPDAHCAEIDWSEVSSADVVISFTEPPGPAQGRGRGGRHVEFGAALAMRKVCIVVGHRGNVFHYLPEIEIYPTWPEALASLVR